ncbi:MAG TPA: anthranilate synthase component I family protein [Ktedonosporobacter sp.]|jgi:salicylate synthetase|nr:anthranilate synthase component I family protein [Ktedonosporobacter sp.]
MVTMPYTPISSYVEVTVANPCGELQSQGIMLLRRLRADGLIKTDQYMLYREHEQQEIHIAADPFAVVTVTVEGVYLRLLESKQLKHGPLEQDPLKQVEKLLASIPLPDATAYGYIAFDLARCYMPTDRLQDLHAPLLSFFVPQLELCISPETIRIKSLDVRVLEGVLDKIITMTWEQPEPLATPERFVVTEDDASWYMQGVQTIVDAIRRDAAINGPFQKAILSRAFIVSRDADLDLLETYRLAEAYNTSVRSYCFRVGADAAVGCSPETLLEADARGNISSNPLAGTRWRGKTPEEDARLTAMLEASHKQRTEHLLSVLEVQHELEAVCIPDSVHVRGLAHVQKYRTVQHLASRLSGVLASPYTVWDALRVLFPGVTVSGIAKSSALEWITRLEPTPRGIYAGAVGWINSSGTADFAIAIRTIFQREKTVLFQAGAGIVTDSDPRDEYEETWHKMQTMWPFMVRAKREEGDSNA